MRTRPTPTPPTPRRAARGVALVLGAWLAVAAAPALAHEHDAQRSGHPLEVVGAVLYPVGWLLDTVIVRPLHWLAHHEPVATVTGHATEALPLPAGPGPEGGDGGPEQ